MGDMAERAEQGGAEGYGCVLDGKAAEQGTVEYRQGFKVNIRTGTDTKFVRAVKVTPANTHDGHYLEELIESGAPFLQRTGDGVVEESSGVNKGTLAGSREASDSGDEVPGIYADGVYNSKANRAFIKRKGLKTRINQGKPKGKPMPKAVARANAKRSSVRARVEHVFAHMKNCYCLFICTIGLARATAKLKLACLAYNFDRLIFLDRRRCMEESI